MSDIAVIIQQWTDQYPFVGYGLIEEMAFEHCVRGRPSPSGSTSDNMAASGPTIVEIEAFLYQMNTLNEQQQRTAAGRKRRGATPASSVMNRGASAQRAASVGSYEDDDDDDEDDETSAATGRQKLHVFTSSITASRTVKDHNRRLQYLLEALKLPYDLFDVADSKFIQTEVVRRVKAAIVGPQSPTSTSGGASGAAYGGGDRGLSVHLPASANELLPFVDSPAELLERCLPIVFYDQQLLGTYADLQYLDDDEPNHNAIRRILAAAGCKHRI